MNCRRGRGIIRLMDTPQIISDPKVLMGKPVIAGTRISVELILEKLGAGDSVDDLLADYPHLSRESIGAAVTHGREGGQ